MVIKVTGNNKLSSATHDGNTCNVGQNPQRFLAKMRMLRGKECAKDVVQVLVLTEELQLIIRCTTDDVTNTTHHWCHHLATTKGDL